MKIYFRLESGRATDITPGSKFYNQKRTVGTNDTLQGELLESWILFRFDGYNYKVNLKDIELLAGVDILSTEETTTFEKLNIGDLFRMGNIEYRKVPPIKIPGVGTRNAAMNSNQSWVYFDPDVIVIRYGTSDYLVDKMRAKNQEKESE